MRSHVALILTEALLGRFKAVLIGVVVVTCAVSGIGCDQTNQHGGQPSVAAVGSTLHSADEESLVVGMPLGDALEMITRRGIEFKISRGEWGRSPVAAAEMFVIERRDVDDALILWAESEHGEKMSVRDIRWAHNYYNESRLPKAARRSKSTHLQEIRISEVERVYSYELNPHNVEKVKAREEAAPTTRSAR